MSDEIWGVWCRVSGGITGTREAWAKSDDGCAIRTTREDAERIAREWQDRMDGRAHRSADFRYTARRFGGWE